MLAFAVAAMLSTPGLAKAEPAGVTVDASGLEAVGEEIAAGAAAELNALLEREALDPTSLRVRIAWLDADEINYAIYATFDRALPDDQLPLIETCRGCSSKAVVTKAVSAIETKLVPEEKARLAGDPGPAEGPIEPPPPPPQLDRQPPPRQGLGPMGKGGIGLLVSGAALAITGGALVGVGKTRPAADMSQIRDFRPTGYTLLGTGGVMLVVGAILLGVDRAKTKKPKQNARLDPISLGGRF